MNALVESKLAQVHAQCEKYHVARLELFGSATTDAWDPTASDLDFLVTFSQPPAGMLGFDQYIDLMMDLEQLYLRRIDLVEEKAVRNPYFLSLVGKQRTQLYERTSQSTAAAG